MKLADELVLEIYKHCDTSTRINVNRAMHWNYKNINPYFDHIFKDKPPPTGGIVIGGNLAVSGTISYFSIVQPYIHTPSNPDGIYTYLFVFDAE